MIDDKTRGQMNVFYNRPVAYILYALYAELLPYFKRSLTSLLSQSRHQPKFHNNIK